MEQTWSHSLHSTPLSLGSTGHWRLRLQIFRSHAIALLSLSFDARISQVGPALSIPSFALIYPSRNRNHEYKCLRPCQHLVSRTGKNAWSTSILPSSWAHLFYFITPTNAENLCLDTIASACLMRNTTTKMPTQRRAISR